jgi:hypothetical protein
MREKLMPASRKHDSVPFVENGKKDSDLTLNLGESHSPVNLSGMYLEPSTGHP